MNCRYVASPLHNGSGLSSKSRSCGFVHRRSPIIGTSRVSRTITAIRQIVFRTSFGRCQTPRRSYTRARAAPSHCNFVSRELHTIQSFRFHAPCAGVHEQNANEFSFNMRLMSSPADRRPSGAAAFDV